MRSFSRMIAGLILVTGFTGCAYRTVEPVKLETIAPNEEGFLIPLTGDTKKQVSTASEEFLRQVPNFNDVNLKK